MSCHSPRALTFERPLLTQQDQTAIECAKFQILLTSYVLVFLYNYYPNEVQALFDLIIASHLVFAILKHKVL